MSKRVLTLVEAVYVGSMLTLGRAAPVAPTYFLPILISAMGPELEIAIRDAIVAGPAGLAVGSAIHLVRRGRMVTGRAIFVLTLVAIAGGLIATFAGQPAHFGIGLFVIAVALAVTVVFHVSVRIRERREAPPEEQQVRLGRVNAELEFWTAASFTVVAGICAVLAYFISWRVAMGAVTVLIAIGGVVAIRVWKRPEAESRPADQEPLLRLLKRLLRRGAVRRQLLATAATLAAFVAYWHPLPLLIGELGWGNRGMLWLPLLGGVRFLTKRRVDRFAKRVGIDSIGAARVAFGWSLLAAVALGAALGVHGWSWAPFAAIGLVALGLWIAETASFAGWWPSVHRRTRRAIRPRWR